MSYHELMHAVFPDADYPRAWRYGQNGGPPGCAMAFGSALRRIGARVSGIGGEKVVFFKPDWFAHPAEVHLGTVYSVFRIDWIDTDDGNCVAWAVTADEAARLASEHAGATVSPVKLPATRHGLVKWLNINLSRDNG